MASVVIVAIVISGLALTMLNTPSPPTETGEDTTPPVVTILKPTDKAIVTGAVNITFTAQDSGNITSYEIVIDGAIRATVQSYLWRVTRENAGQHLVVCRATDDSGNTGSESLVLTVNYTSTVPEVYTRPVKIMAYNIYESGSEPEWKKVVEEENPDIMVLVETGNFDDKGNALLNRVVREFNEYFNDTYPYIGYTAQGITYDTSGEAILSRFPIIKFTQIPKVKLDNGKDYWVTHDFIEAVIRLNGTDVHFIGCHLKASQGDTNQMRRERETEGIINYMDDLGNVPIVYMGDLNAYSPDDTGNLGPAGDDLGYGPLTMMLHPNDTVYGNYSSKVHNFTDVFRALNPTDPGYSFGHWYDLKERIDYIIVNQFFNGLLINSTVGDTADANKGSDHYSVDAFIRWPNATAGATIQSKLLGSSIQQRGPSPNILLLREEPNSNSLIALVQKPLIPSSPISKKSA
ncbi:MAG: endonuclease/exonuclease/phosphatase family protein [Candidatus Thorarchaeota archaeon]